MMKKIIVTCATREEFVQIDWPSAEIGHLLTGLGKTKSAYYLAEAIREQHPDLVINVGTAGTLHHKVGDIFVCRHFVDRDMQKLKDYGVSYEIELPEDALDFIPSCLYNNKGICNTGDTFLTEHEDVAGDVIDMEAYAQAFVCQSMKVPFVAVKYVTDIVGQNSVEIWQDKLKDAVSALRTFLNHSPKTF